MNKINIQERETPINVIRGAVKVKNAQLMKVGEYKYVLQHYDTIILEVINGEVIIITNISNSSNRAINQALEYLQHELNKEYKGLTGQAIAQEFRKAGKFVRDVPNGQMYPMGN